MPERPVIFNKFGSVARKAQIEKVLDVSKLLPADKGAVHYEAESAFSWE